MYTLLVLAAGLGTRYGGSKQVEEVGPNGEFILDYSIYDAIKAGFNRVIFIVNKSNIDIIKNSIGQRINNYIEVEYIIQDINDLPAGFINKKRVKPWGTAHAIYAARDLIKSSFVVINADDLYGYDAFKKAIVFLDNNQDRSHYLSVCYKASNTLSKNGSVKRGIVNSENGILKSIIESKIEYKDNSALAYPLDGSKCFKVTDDTLVTVNFFVFSVNFMKYILEDINLFLEKNINNISNEYMIPDVLSRQIQHKEATVYIETSLDKWYGITYKQDKDDIVKIIDNLIKENVYPKNLWDD